ncbi:glycosyltransferase family 2 protein [Pendulispora rubella]|uniref:Glycosyltransferase family 2 protein n=1 Tax=Pendulispora rubella TaxID=2741070 RepID=A0ABZ2L4N2_9BACT
MTIVCPVFNEETTVPLFYDRLSAAIALMSDRVRFELLFVNNRSTDGTLAEIHKIQARDPRVGVITLSRNFGYQASITAGMRTARGDAIVNIDVDCEDPPEMIPRFIERWLDGADVAYGIREKREEFFLMHLARKLFYRGTRMVADHEIVLDMAEFFLVDKRVRDFVLATKSTFPFVRGQVGYVGFRREGIPYKRQRRISGTTHYNLVSATRFGVGGILSSSTMPLRVLGYVGVVGFLLDCLGAIALLVGGDTLEVRTMVRVLFAFMALHAGWLVLAAGTLGIYLARVYKDTIELPLYVVDEKLSSLPLESRQ